MGPRLSLDLIKLGLALLAVAALGAWFVRVPEASRESEFDRPAVTAILVDTSASVTRARKTWRRWAVRAVGDAARAAASRGDEVALVSFDSAAVRRAGPLDADGFFELMRQRSREWLEPSAADTATDLAGAARVAAAMLSEPGRAPGSIVVLGDGVPTGDDPSSALLEDPAWTLQLVEPPPPTSVDLGVVRTLHPRKAAPGVAVPIELDLVLVGPPVAIGAKVIVDWSLQMTGTDSATRGRALDGSEGTLAPAALGSGLFFSGTVLTGSAEVSVPETACGPQGSLERASMAAGRGAPSRRFFRIRFSVPGQKLGSAALRAEVRLAGAQSDPFPENDLATAEWTVGDPVRVLVCAPTLALSSAVAFFNGAAFDGIEFVGVRVEALAGALAPEDGARPDAVISMELPFASLPADALQAFVETWGGGWLHAAGWPATRSDGGELSQLAALEPDVEPKPPRDIVFLVDGSGSMEGDRWMSMRTALRELVPRVPATDTLSLRFFTKTVGPEELRLEPVELGENGKPSAAVQAARDRQIARLLRLDVPGGATNIVKSLWDLARLRSTREHVDQVGPDGAPVNDGLIILISDGETQSLKSRRKFTRSEIAKGRDDLVIIHVGGERGTVFLKGFLRKGEEVVLVQDLALLVDRLREAILDLSIVEGARLAPAVESAAQLPPELGEDWRATLGAVLERIPSVEPVVIQSAIPSRPTEGAVALAGLVSEAMTLTGRTAIFAAAAERGRGLTATLAASPVEADPGAPTGGATKSWASELRHRSGWLAPLLRDAARRRDDADAELISDEEQRAVSVEWVHDPQRLLGADSRVPGPVLWIESLPKEWLGEEASRKPSGKPSGRLSELVGEFRLPARLDSDGQRVEGRVLARAALDFVPSAVDPRTARMVTVPEQVLALDAGTEVALQISSAGPSGAEGPEPIRLIARGPVEATSLGAGQVAAPLRLARADAGLPDARGLRAREAADGASGPFSVPKSSPRRGPGSPRRGHPWVPGLLLCGLGAVFVGAALQTRAG